MDNQPEQHQQLPLMGQESQNKSSDNDDLEKKAEGARIEAFRRSLHRSLVEKSLKEKKAKEAMMRISISKELSAEQILKTINVEWTGYSTLLNVNDSHITIDFSYTLAKNNFKNWLRANKEGTKWLTSISDIPDPETTILKSPVKLEISRVKSAFSKDRIEATILTALDIGGGGGGDTAEQRNLNLEEGDFDLEQSRNITLDMDSNGLIIIYGILKGEIKHIKTTAEGETVILTPKILIKPNRCDQCLSRHSHTANLCQDIRCERCTQKGHRAVNCKAKEMLCGNCGSNKHRTIDLRCPHYLLEIDDKVKSIDLPSHLVDNDRERDTVIKAMKFI